MLTSLSFAMLSVALVSHVQDHELIKTLYYFHLIKVSLVSEHINGANVYFQDLGWIFYCKFRFEIRSN